MKPTLLDTVLGELTYNERLAWYKGQVTFEPLGPFAVALSTESTDEVDAMLHNAGQFVRDIVTIDQRARDYAAEALLDLYNDEWREGPILSQEDFIRRLTLESVTFYPDGSIEMLYDDGDLFWDHVVIVSAVRGPRFTGADIAG
jgi:hypothetical protein